MNGFAYTYALVTISIFISWYCCTVRMIDFESKNEVKPIYENGEIEISYLHIALLCIPILHLIFLVTFIAMALCSDKTLLDLYNEMDKELEEDSKEDSKDND